MPLLILNSLFIAFQSLLSLVIFALIISSLSQMSHECVGSRKGYERPAISELRHDRFDRPYQAPKGVFQGFFSDLFVPLRRFNRETGLYNYYGDRSINYFYRKTNDSSGDYASDVFIESWIWYRQMMFKMAVFVNSFLNLKKIVKYTSFSTKKEGGKERGESMIPSLLRSFMFGLLLCIVAPLFTEFATLLPIIPGVAGMLGTLVASMRVSIFMKPFFIIIILIWIIPAFILFWIQFFHGIYLLFTSGVGKKEGISFEILFMIIMKRFGLIYVFLSPLLIGLFNFTNKELYDFAKSTQNEEEDDIFANSVEEKPRSYGGKDMGVSILMNMSGYVIMFIILWITIASKFGKELKSVDPTDKPVWIKSIKISAKLMFPFLQIGSKFFNQIDSEFAKNYGSIIPLIDKYYKIAVRPYEASP